MTPLPRRVRLVLGALAVPVLLAGLLTGALLIEPDLARPALVHLLEKRAQREIRLERLSLHLDEHRRPVLTLHGLNVANVPWAGTKPLIVAREASFTFDWHSLWSAMRVVPEMRLVDAEVHLQRQADGLRNWRLTRPDDRGPARLRVLRLQAERSRLQFVHQGMALSIEISSQPLVPAQGAYVQQLRFRGELRGAPFEGSADTGAVLSLVDTGEFFALRGQARSGASQLQLEGRLADLLQLASLDAHTRLRGDTLAALKPFMPRPPWPHSLPYRFDGELTKRGPRWTARDARLQIARTDIAGQADYEKRSDGRNVLHATLHSERLYLDELPTQPGDKPPHGPVAKPPMRLLPQQPVPLEGLRRLDGELELAIGTLHAPAWPPAHDLRATLTLDRGRLGLQLRAGTLAGGALKGEFALDASGRSPQARLDLRGQGLVMTRLWPRLPRQEGLQWPALQGHVQLRGQGRSIADWLGSADGRVDLSLAGGSVNRRLDARLGLDAGRMLGTLLGRGDAPVPIRCGAVSLAFANGAGRTRHFMLDTDRTRLDGEGRVHLGEETWALLLTPQREAQAALQLPRSLLAQGTFRGARYELAPREPLPHADRKACG